MAERVVVAKEEIVEDEFGKIEYFSSGSLTADLMLGGGWAQGRVSNIVGDRSSGKTLLATEALANWTRTVGKPENAKYVDAESALDAAYADAMGMPRGIQLHSEGMVTVQELFVDFDHFADELDGEPGMYVLDSLDALSDDEEMALDIDKGTYGMQKPKLLSKFFRQRCTMMANKNITLMVISQMRDKIGVTFGEKKTRSGGKALDFYCSQIVWLSEMAKIKRTSLNLDRVVGIETLAKNKKNKVGLPFREAELTIMFNYGIDDEISMLNWLKDTDKNNTQLSKVLQMTPPQVVAALGKARAAGERDVINDIRDALSNIVTERWMQIEETLKPPMRKYT